MALRTLDNFNLKNKNILNIGNIPTIEKMGLFFVR